MDHIKTAAVCRIQNSNKESQTILKTRRWKTQSKQQDTPPLGENTQEDINRWRKDEAGADETTPCQVEVKNTTTLLDGGLIRGENYKAFESQNYCLDLLQC